MKRAWAWILLAGTGCIDLKSSYPERHFYTLEAHRSGAERTPEAGTVLRVRRFTASKLCEGSELVTRTGGATYEFDFYNVFCVPPSGQVGEQTQRWLSEAKLFGNVVGPGSSYPETHLLEGNLIALNGDFRRIDAPVASLELQFMLMKVSPDCPGVLFQKTFRQEITIAKAEPDALVEGWSIGLGSILRALEEDLSKVMNSRWEKKDQVR